VFGHERAFFEGTSYSYAHYHRRTGIGAGIFYRGQDGFFYAFDPVCRLQHENTAHIFASKPFGSYGNVERFSFDHLIMDDCRSVVFCVDALNGVGHNGFAQISFGISLSYALIYRVCQGTALYMDFLPQLYKYHGHSRVLANGYHIPAGYDEILLQLV
jgi:hypothetical protein